jgi:hypothetical protein
VSKNAFMVGEVAPCPLLPNTGLPLDAALLSLSERGDSFGGASGFPGFFVLPFLLGRFHRGRARVLDLADVDRRAWYGLRTRNYPSPNLKLLL